MDTIEVKIEQIIEEITVNVSLAEKGDKVDFRQVTIGHLMRAVQLMAGMYQLQVMVQQHLKQRVIMSEL